MNLLAIDPGLRSLGGYIHFSDNKKKDIAFTIETKKIFTYRERFKKIDKSLEKIIIENKIDLMFLENYSFGNFGSSDSISKLGEITGLIKSIAWSKKNNCKGIIMIPIPVWKSFHRGLPKNKNKKYVEFVNKKHKKNFKTCDECDAYLMMTAVYNLYMGVVKSNAQLELKRKIEKYKIIWED